jgi:hypothetical protein
MTKGSNGLQMLHNEQVNNPDHRWLTKQGKTFPCLTNGAVGETSDIDFRLTTVGQIPDDVVIVKRYSDSREKALSVRRRKFRIGSRTTYKSKYDFQYMASGNSFAIRIHVGPNWFNHNFEQKIAQIRGSIISSLNVQKNKGIIDPKFQIGFSIAKIYIANENEVVDYLVIWRLDGTPFEA